MNHENTKSEKHEMFRIIFLRHEFHYEVVSIRVICEIRVEY